MMLSILYRFKSWNCNIISSVLKKNSRAGSFSVSKSDSLADEKIDLSLHDLPPSTKVTLRSEVVLNSKFHFSAFGFHHSDHKGSLLPSNDPSVGGTYTGADPMGLIWSLKPEKGQLKGLRFQPDALVPTEFKLLAYKGHTEDIINAEKLAETTIRRHWISENVSYEHVRHGNLRGLLFTPKDKSRKYSGVLDIYGTGGGLMAHRAALLADKGFVTFALAFFRYEDLPKLLVEINLDYFVDAVDYLRQLDCVKDCGVGAIGLSKGADLVVDIAALSPHIKAVAFINGIWFTQLTNLIWKGKLHREAVPVEWSRAYKDKDGNIVCKDCNMVEGTSPIPLPVERVNGKVGFFISEDDMNIPALASAQILASRMEEHGRVGDYELHVFEGAGHVLEPSYIPHSNVQYMGRHMGGHVVAYGGTPTVHKDAQLRFWPLLIDFLRSNLDREL